MPVRFRILLVLAVLSIVNYVLRNNLSYALPSMRVVQAPMFPVSAGAIASWFPVGGWGFPNAMLSTGVARGQAITGGS